MMGPPTRSASATAGERRFRLSPSLALTAAIPLIYVIVFAVFLVRTGDTDWDQILSFHEHRKAAVSPLTPLPGAVNS